MNKIFYVVFFIIHIFIYYKAFHNECIRRVDEYYNPDVVVPVDADVVVPVDADVVYPTAVGPGRLVGPSRLIGPGRLVGPSEMRDQIIL